MVESRSPDVPSHLAARPDPKKPDPATQQLSRWRCTLCVVHIQANLLTVVAELAPAGPERVPHDPVALLRGRVDAPARDGHDCGRRSGGGLAAMRAGWG